MKKLIHSIIALLLSTTVFAQAPQSFKYQAVARDASGEVIADQQVSFQISILQGNENGTAVYTETHIDSTNQFGLITLEIGTGTSTGDFTGIDWSTDAYFIQIEMDVTGGTSYTLMGTSQLLSVPYALHARTAANIFSGNYSDLTNKPEIPDTLSDLVLDSGNRNISNLANPTNNQDAATKAYVDELKGKILELQAEVGVTDIDGNHYKAVRIGNQVWLAENLKTTKYNNGEDIPLVTNDADWDTLTTPGYCWYDNDSATYSKPYGALYSWYTVNTAKLCPINWHVPTLLEWSELTDYLGGENLAGGKLKENGTTHWNSPNTWATNETGFTALPGGKRESDGNFYLLGSYCFIWSKDEKTRFLVFNSAELYIGNPFGTEGSSVRCVKDK